jgi:hypothetical protein
VILIYAKKSKEKNTREMVKLTDEIFGLESHVTNLFGEESEYVDRAKNIRDKLWACIKQ